MIPRILSILLTPLDYLAAAYLVARGRWVAFKRVPIAKAEAQARDVAQGFADGIAAGSSPTCDGCGAGVGEECRFAAPPPVACCYCGKPAEGWRELEGTGEQLCRACGDGIPGPTVRAKLAADRAQAAVAARAEEAGGLGKVSGQDERPCVPCDACGQCVTCDCCRCAS